MVIVYLALLAAGMLCFALHYLAQFRFATALRNRYPQQWLIVAEDASGQPSGRLQTWLRLQQVLRSPAPALFEDATITGWQRAWRYSSWLAWACWLAAIALQWWARH